jgi:hypothetical protein
MLKKIYIFLFRAFFVLGLFFISAQSVSAATVYTNSSSGNDTSGDGSSGSPYKTFHKAYTEASANDTIDLTGTFTWTDEDETGDTTTSGYTIGKNLTIQGQNADVTFVQADSSENSADRRVFSTSVDTTVTFSKLNIRYGKVGSNQSGGGVNIDGIATMQYVDVGYNRAPDGSGGGVNVRGKLTFQDSSVHHNVAHYKGGGLNRSYYSGSGGTPGESDLLDIINSTISNNQVTQTVAYLEGGGVFYRRGSGSITNSTISYNTIVNGGGTSTHGVGTGDSGSTVALKNNIIANNTLTNCWSGEIGHRSSGGGTFTDNGGNVFGKLGYYRDGLTVAATSWVDQTNSCTSPDGTFVLQDGGATSGSLNLNSTLATNSSLYGTLTHAITTTGGVAVDNALTGTNGSIAVPSSDQRGASRSGDTDVGAYEYGGETGVPTVSTYFPADGAIDTTSTANLILTFDEAVDAESGNIVIYNASDDSTFETIDVTSGNISGSGTLVITINPTNNLVAQTQYYLKIDATAFDDTSGNSYAGITDTTTWNFTTADFADPTIQGYFPTVGFSRATTTANLFMNFSEAVDAESGNIVIYKNSDNSVLETIDVTSNKVSGSGSKYIVVNPSVSFVEQTLYYVLIDSTAFDDNVGNSFAGITVSTTWRFTVGDFTEPTISSRNYSRSNGGATLSWSTDEAASSRLQFGLTTNYGTLTDEENTDSRVTSHSMDLSSLYSCTTFHYQTVSADSDSNYTTSTDSTFTTGGCIGDAEVLYEASKSAALDEVSSLSLNDGTANIGLTVPQSYGGSAAEFQMKQLASDGVIGSTGRPSIVHNLIGSHTYSLLALTGNNATLTSFDEPLTITISYTDAEVAGYDESTLGVQRYGDDEAWSALTDCTVDTDANTITCTTTNFSTFALFGQSSSASTDSGSSSGGGGGLFEETSSVGKLSSQGENKAIAYTNTQIDFASQISGSGKVDDFKLIVDQVDKAKDSINFTIMPNQIHLSIGVKEIKYIDLDGDRVGDVSVTLENIEVSRINLFLRSTIPASLAYKGENSLPNIAREVLNQTKSQIKQTVKSVITKLPSKQVDKDVGLSDTIELKTSNKNLPVKPKELESVRKESRKAPCSVSNFLTIGSVSAEVRELQKKLLALGYFKAPKTTAIFGPATKQAVIDFQKAEGISPASGWVGPKTREKLNILGCLEVKKSAIFKTPKIEAKPIQQSTKRIGISRFLYLDDVGVDVRRLQEILMELGYFKAPKTTAIFGPATKQAVIDFQKAEGISPASGWVGPKTREKLNSLRIK